MTFIMETTDGPRRVTYRDLPDSILWTMAGDPEAEAELKRRLTSETGDSVTGEE